MAVSFGVNGHSFDAHFAGCSHDAKGDFAPIGN
jgi:hypothetical protein